MDQQLLFLINRTWTHPALDPVMAAFSSWDLWWPFLVMGGVAVAIWGGFRGRMMLLTIGLAVGITDGLVVDTIKNIVGRPRPHEVLEGVRTLDLAKARPRFLALGKPLREEFSVARISPPHGNSFPSGHASNNFALAAVLTAFSRRWGWLMFIPGTLVAYSRIYVGSHWPMDVFVSCLIGAGIGFLTAAAVEFIWRRWGGKLLPALYLKQPSLLAA